MAAGNAMRYPPCAVLCKGRMRIRIAAVAAAVLFVGVLSYTPGCRDEPLVPGSVAQATPGASEAEGASSARSPSSPGSHAGEQTAGPDGGMYVWVPGGEFMMGSMESDVQYAIAHFGTASAWLENEKPVHKVRITKGFWLGKHEVTNEQYAAFLNAYGGNRDSEGHELLDMARQYSEIEKHGGRYTAKSGREQHPVVEVSWYGATEYCRHHGLRLPTEAQWEYAARGPKALRYPWGDAWDEKRCCAGTNRKQYSGAKTFAVGSFADGATWCGALDMAGNVSEWCRDWYDNSYYATSPMTDPTGPATGTFRLMRGGSWCSNGNGCRSASRAECYPDRTLFGLDFGFRCLMTP